MGEYTSLMVLGAVAVITGIGGFLIHRGLNPKSSAKAKAGRKPAGKAAAKKGRKGTKDTFVQDINLDMPEEKGGVWQDDDMHKLKEGKDKGVYKGDGRIKDDDGEYESWEKYS